MICYMVFDMICYLDMLFLTETWLRSGSVDNGIIGDLVPEGYSFKHKPRESKHRGGGLGILFKSSIGLKLKNNCDQTSSFESMHCCITIHSTNIHTALIYRVPPSQKNKIPKNLFISEISYLMESCSIEGGKLLLLGDFNIPWNNQDNTERQQFDDLLTSCNLTRHNIM